MVDNHLEIPMDETRLRKWHRNIGLLFAAFMIIQAGTGMFLTVIKPPERENGNGDAVYSVEGEACEHGYTPGRGENNPPSVLTETTAFIHRGGGIPGVFFRLFTGAGLLWLTVSGIWIIGKVQLRESDGKAGKAPEKKRFPIP